MAAIPVGLTAVLWQLFLLGSQLAHCVVAALPVGLTCVTAAIPLGSDLCCGSFPVGLIASPLCCDSFSVGLTAALWQLSQLG